MGEGFGLVLLEALAAGLPLIASKNCGGPDIIEEGVNGFTIEAGNTDELIDKILWFYNNMDKLPQMQENAIKSIEDKGWDAYEKKLISQLKLKISEVSKMKQT
jgi:glycosyltransferase involved in cell wall biosynthesis